MQEDMHYYGIYALARTAGLSAAISQRIADASQFVGVYTKGINTVTLEGTAAIHSPSGHGILYNNNFDGEKMKITDPYMVWIPFHFLPGNKGTSYYSRMKCSKDSEVTRKTIGEILTKSNEEFSPELMGVAAHIIADTYSHHGFSGLPCASDHPGVKDITLDLEDEHLLNYVWSKAKGFTAAFSKTSTGHLGHTFAADFPDRPYLQWHLQYEDGSSEIRDNRPDYMEACEALFEFFNQFKAAAPHCADEAGEASFEKIRPTLSAIISFEGKKEERISAWQVAASTGNLVFMGKIPAYQYGSIDRELTLISGKSQNRAKGERIWLFINAVETARDTILTKVLPEFGLTEQNNIYMLSSHADQHHVSPPSHLR